MKKVINHWFLDGVLSPLIGGADNDELCAQFRETDMNDPEVAKTIINQYFKPSYIKRPYEYKMVSKNTLSYYLTTRQINFERVCDSNLLPFNDSLVDHYQLFMQIWEVFFPGEDYHMNDIENVILSDDIEETRNPVIER